MKKAVVSRYYGFTDNGGTELVTFVGSIPECINLYEEAKKEAVTITYKKDKIYFNGDEVIASKITNGFTANGRYYETMFTVGIE